MLVSAKLRLLSHARTLSSFGIEPESFRTLLKSMDVSLTSPPIAGGIVPDTFVLYNQNRVSFPSLPMPDGSVPESAVFPKKSVFRFTSFPMASEGIDP